MIEANVAGFDISNLAEFFKNYKGLKTLEWWHEWNLIPSSGTDDYHRLYQFLYTNLMRRIRTILAVTVVLEFESKSEANLIVIVSGSNRGDDFNAQVFLENKIFQDLKNYPNADWIIKILSS